MEKTLSLPHQTLYIKKLPINGFSRNPFQKSHPTSSTTFKTLKNSVFNPMVLGKIQFPATTAAASHGGTEPLKAAAVAAPASFVEEMRAVAMKLHTKEQAKEGEKEVKGPEEMNPSKWEPSMGGYLKFLVDSKLVFETLERIVVDAHVDYYAEFRNTGLERSESLATDLEWFKGEGHVIPEPSAPGITYASFLEELAKKDPHAFICHFYNVYFAHSAGGRMIGKKIAEKILNKKELEFYKWDDNLRQLLQNVRDKLNIVAEKWTREEKNHCLEETEKSFKYSGDIMRHILT